MARKPPMFDGHPASFADVNAVGMVRAVCQYVSDGDTADFLLDLGWYQYAYVVLRIRGIDTPELRGTTGAELEAAQRAAARAEELILDQPVIIRSYKQRTTFGRFVADTYFESGALAEGESDETIEVAGHLWLSLGQVLLDEGLARAVP